MIDHEVMKKDFGRVIGNPHDAFLFKLFKFYKIGRTYKVVSSAYQF